MKPPIYIAGSPGFIIVASIAYVTVVVSLCLVTWFWWLKLVLFLLLVADYRRVIYMYGLRVHKYAVAVIWLDCDKWQYQMYLGQQYKGRLIRSLSFCSGLALVLCIQHINGIRYIFIPRDSLSNHNYRFLAYKLNCSRD